MQLLKICYGANAAAPRRQINKLPATGIDLPAITRRRQPVASGVFPSRQGLGLPPVLAPGPWARGRAFIQPTSSGPRYAHKRQPTGPFKPVYLVRFVLVCCTTSSSSRLASVFSEGLVRFGDLGDWQTPLCKALSSASCWHHTGRAAFPLLFGSGQRSEVWGNMTSQQPK